MTKFVEFITLPVTKLQIPLTRTFSSTFYEKLTAVKIKTKEHDFIITFY